MPAIFHPVLSIAFSLGMVTVGVMLAVRSRNVDKGRGPILVAALLIGLHGTLEAVFQVTWMLYPASILAPGESPPAGPALHTFAHQAAQPLWRYLGPVSVVLGVLLLLVALVMAGSQRRATLVGAYGPRGPHRPLPPPHQNHHGPPGPHPPQAHWRSRGEQAFGPPTSPPRRPGSHRRPPAPEPKPLPPRAEPPPPRGRHHAPGPLDDPPAHH